MYVCVLERNGAHSPVPTTARTRPQMGGTPVGTTAPVGVHLSSRNSNMAHASSTNGSPAKHAHLGKSRRPPVEVAISSSVRRLHPAPQLEEQQTALRSYAGRPLCISAGAPSTHLCPPSGVRVHEHILIWSHAAERASRMHPMLAQCEACCLLLRGLTT